MRALFLLLIAAGLLATVAASAGPPRERTGKKKPETAAARGRPATINLPFLGEIKGVTREKIASLRTDAGGRVSRKFQVLTTNKGRFVQAKFFEEGATDYANSVEEVEAGMKARDHEIVGLVDDPKVDSWERVLDEVAVYLGFDHVTQLSITLVHYRRFENAPSPTYLVHIFGRKPLERVRCVVGARAETSYTRDNCL